VASIEKRYGEEEVLWWAKKGGGELPGESAPRITFLRKIIEAAPGYSLSPKQESSHQIIHRGLWNMVSAGYHGTDYYLFYFGLHQPRFRDFSLPDGKFRIDCIDTWNMIINTVAENAQGRVQMELPTQKYLAVRIVKEA
jgi:hypothetical protein